MSSICERISVQNGRLYDLGIHFVLYQPEVVHLTDATVVLLILDLKCLFTTFSRDDSLCYKFYDED